MEFGLSDEQRLLIRGVRDFIKGELAPLEDEIETTGRLDPDKAKAIFNKSRALGFEPSVRAKEGFRRTIMSYL